MVNKIGYGKAIRNGERGGTAGLISYLAKLGLADDDLAEVFSLLRTKNSEPLPAEKSDRQFEPAQFEPPKALASKQTIKLYLAEEQQILREAYQSLLSNHPDIELLGSSDDTSSESLIAAATALEPKVMLLGVRTLQPATVHELQNLREACPDVALVLLFAFYDANGIKALRQFSMDASLGCAYLLKHTVDTVEQLTQVVCSVAEGRIILDPMVMEGLIRTGDGRGSLLKGLSPRELEVLSWVAKGYRNDTIAEVLSRDVKTIERHMNNIYSKLQSVDDTGDDSRDRRVRAALMYLRATGILPTEELIVE